MYKFASVLSLSLAGMIVAMCVGHVSAGSASAKVCSLQSGSQAGAACVSPHGNEYTTGKLVAETTTTLGQKLTFTSGFLVFTCDSRLEGEITHGGSGTITSLTFFDCHSNANTTTNSCTMAIEKLPYAATATKGTAPNGTLNLNSAIALNFNCSGEKCIYSSPNAGTLGEIVVTGGKTATVTATKVPLTKQAGSGFICSSTANLDGTYEVITPDSLYLT